MSSLAELTSNDPSQYANAAGISIRPVMENIAAQPEAIVPELPVVPADPQAFSPDNTTVGSALDRIISRLTGANGQERYQTWPEKLIRSGVTAAGDVYEQGALPAGLRREDFTDIPAPTMPTNDSTALGKFLNVAPVAASPADPLIERALDMSAVAGTGGLAGTTDATLGSAPFLRPALKYKDKIYKAPMRPDAQHLDALPAHLADEFNQMAMSGEDISHYNFGFMNHKGQFLNREDALKYAIDQGLLDPQAGKYGALTSTLLSDSSKPGVAIEAIGKIAEPKLPQGYFDKVPMDMRLSRSGTEPSHPGFRWEVIDSTNNKIMRKDIMSRSGATKTQDNLDNKYGAYKYRVRMTKADELTEKEAQFLKDNNIDIGKSNAP